MIATTAPRPTTTVTRAARLRRAAAVSAAVLGMGAFAGCGGSELATDGDRDRPAPARAQQDERPSPPSSSSYSADASPDAHSGSWESENSYAAEGKRTFMESCERSSGGMTSYCQCVLDELEQTMTFDQFLRDSLGMVKGERPSESFIDAVKTCAPGSDFGSGSDGPLDLS
jgi:hypothetical protein